MIQYCTASPLGLSTPNFTPIHLQSMVSELSIREILRSGATVQITRVTLSSRARNRTFIFIRMMYLMEQLQKSGTNLKYLDSREECISIHLPDMRMAHRNILFFIFFMEPAGMRMP